MKGWAPIGVVAAIVPWNFPLMLLTWKVCTCMCSTAGPRQCGHVVGVSSPGYGEHRGVETCLLHKTHCSPVC